MDEVMYHILQEWYEFIEKSIHIQVDLIGKKQLFISKLIHI